MTTTVLKPVRQGRPCLKWHEEQPDQCHLCWLWVNDSAYRVLWGGAPPPASKPVVAAQPQPVPLNTASPDRPCIHLGADTGERHDCEVCGGRKNVPIHACAKHGRCSPTGRLLYTENGQKIDLPRCPSPMERRLAQRLGKSTGACPHYEPAVDPYFARVYVISLRRTPQRLAEFYRDFPKDWPYFWPEWYEAVDGHQATLPFAWEHWQFRENVKRGAYGCYLSWTGLVRKLIEEKVDRPVCVFEDDAVMVPDALQRMPRYLASLPDGWQIAYLGCEMMQPPSRLNSEVLRVNGADRTHAIILHPRFFEPLERLWFDHARHVDWKLREVARQHQFYAPARTLWGQRAGWSTIMERNEENRTWG